MSACWSTTNSWMSKDVTIMPSALKDLLNEGIKSCSTEPKFVSSAETSKGYLKNHQFAVWGKRQWAWKFLQLGFLKILSMKVLEKARQMIQEQGMDPADLPDGIAEFSESILGITFHGSARATNGFFRGWSNIHRTGSTSLLLNQVKESLHLMSVIVEFHRHI